MYDNCIIDIKFPVEFIPYKFDDYNKFKELIIKEEFINKEFHSWIQSLGLKICPETSRFFSRPPYTKGSIHVDNFDNNASKINFIYDSYDAVMSWYKLIPGKSYTTLINYQGEKIRSFSYSNCQKILSTSSNNHCLINGKMIHCVDVGFNKNQTRKCYSLLLLNNNNQRISWEETIKIFKPYFISGRG